MDQVTVSTKRPMIILDDLDINSDSCKRMWRALARPSIDHMSLTDLNEMISDTKEDMKEYIKCRTIRNAEDDDYSDAFKTLVDDLEEIVKKRKESGYDDFVNRFSMMYKIQDPQRKDDYEKMLKAIYDDTEQTYDKKVEMAHFAGNIVKFGDLGCPTDFFRRPLSSFSNDRGVPKIITTNSLKTVQKALKSPYFESLRSRFPNLVYTFLPGRMLITNKDEVQQESCKDHIHK